MFSSCIFQVSISIGTFVSSSLSLSTTDGTKWTSFKYDWGILRSSLDSDETDALDKVSATVRSFPRRQEIVSLYSIL